VSRQLRYQKLARTANTVTVRMTTTGAPGSPTTPQLIAQVEERDQKIRSLLG
jgi:hypothetical protein